MIRFLLTSSLAVFLVGAGVAADVKLDNPTYASWARNKVGTAVVLQETWTAFNGKTVTYVHTYTLKELTPEQARIECVTIAKLAAGDMTEKTSYPERKQKVLPEGSKPEDAQKPTPTAKAAGAEKLKVGGKEYATQKFTTSEPLPGGYTLTTTYWYADDVPGRLVQKVAEKKTDNFLETSKHVLVEVKKP